MVSTPFIVHGAMVAFPLFFVYMLLVAMRTSPFSALLTSLVTDERRGSLMSLTVAVGQLGYAVGGALAGVLFAGAGYRSNAFLGAAAILGFGSHRLDPHSRSRNTPGRPRRKRSRPGARGPSELNVPGGSQLRYAYLRRIFTPPLVVMARMVGPPSPRVVRSCRPMRPRTVMGKSTSMPPLTVPVTSSAS